MPTQVRLFISAGPNEDPTRELLGRALAELPVNVGWVIKRTPDVDSVAECHLFVVVLGIDISAPVGLEVWWARRTEKPIFGYLSMTNRTPAGQVFVQENAGLDWTRWADLAALRREFLKDISRFLLGHPDRYGLTLIEGETLRGFLGALEKASAVASATPREGEPTPLSKATGAGGGGVILAPGKDTVPGARLIGDDE